MKFGKTILVLFSLIVATVTSARTIYFKPNSGWKMDARFALYLWDNEQNSEWRDFIPTSSDDGVYKATFQDTYIKMIFVRLDGNSTENNWENSWNQSLDFDTPTEDNLLYAMDEGTWEQIKVTVYEDSPDVNADVYTLVGAFVAEGERGVFTDGRPFGTAWDSTVAENDMVIGEDGIYTKRYENVELEAGTIEYKVVKNHGWEENWGFDDSNADCKVKEAGTYNITFKFSPDELLENLYHLNCELKTSYNPFSGVTITPVEGEVNSLKKITLTFGNAKNIQIIYGEDIEQPYLYNKDTEAEHLCNIGYGYKAEDEECNEIVILIEDDVTEDGDYTLIIPAGIIEIDEVFNEEMKFEYTVTSEQAFEIFVKNVPIDFGTPYVFTWSGEMKFAGEWPGTRMSNYDLGEDGMGYTWQGTADEVPQYIIFNDGGRNDLQTPDLVFENHKVYDLGELLGITAEPTFSVTAENVTVESGAESFDIVALVKNTSEVDAENVEVKLLKSSETIETMVIDYLAAGEENEVIFTLYEVVPGTYTYYVQVADQAQTVVVVNIEGAPLIESVSIVGDLTGGWDNDLDMTQSQAEADVYTLKIDDFRAEENRTYEYKLRTNHSWDDYILPVEGNQTWTPDATGLYDLTITADLSTHTLALSAVRDRMAEYLTEDLMTTVVTPPAGLVTSDYRLEAHQHIFLGLEHEHNNNYVERFKIGFDDGDVYLSDLCMSLSTTTWLKGRLNNDSTAIILRSPQNFGSEEGDSYYFVAATYKQGENNDADYSPVLIGTHVDKHEIIEIPYNATTGEVTFPATFVSMEESPLGSCGGYYDSMRLSRILGTADTPLFEVVDSLLTISTSTANATIYYTLDGSIPTTDSDIYSAPIELTGNCTVKAFAMAEHYDRSPVSEHIVDWFKSANVTFSYNNFLLTLHCVTEGAVIRYTIDDSNPSASSTVYTEPLHMTENCTVKAIAMKANWHDSEVTSYTFSLDQYIATAPVITRSQDTITITSADDLPVYYTTDGSTPTTESTRYTAPFAVDHNCTVRAIAAGEGYITSAVTSFEVTGFKVTEVLFSYSDKVLAMACATEGATIHYTTDGTVPTDEGAVYAAPLTMTENCVVRAMAVKQNFDSSEVTTFEVDDFKVSDVTFGYSNFVLTLSCATEGATIHYTMDGTAPTSASPVYAAPLDMTEDCTVTAIGMKANWHSSEVTSYTFSLNQHTASAPVITRQGNTITITSAEDLPVYYTTDGSTPTTESTRYTAPFAVDHNCTVRAIAAGEGYITSVVTSFEVTGFKVAEVHFSYSDKVLTMACVTEGATIHYTTDGTVPTAESAVYTAPLTMTENCVVRAMAVKQDYDSSEVTSFEVDDFKVSDVTFGYSNFVLTLSCATEGATIHYTMDGTVPTSASPVYAAPLDMTEDCTVTAVGMKANWHSSEVTSYTFSLNQHTASAPVITRQGNTITITSADDLPVYYTTDGSMPTTESTRYTAPFSVDHNCTVRAIAAGEGYITSAVTSFEVDDFRVAVPEMAFDYANGQLRLSCATPGHTILYSIGDSEPDIVYTEPLALTDNRRVLACGVAENYHSSDTVAFVPVGNGVLAEDGVTFRISGAVTAAELLFVRNVLSGVDHLDMTDAVVEGETLPDEAFAGMSLLTYRSPKTLARVGERLFGDCRRLAAVVWNAAMPVPADALTGVDNPNLLLYVNNENYGSSAGVQNLVVNHFARTVTLADGTAEANFHCPEQFTANRISYSHVYKQTSGIDGSCRGWETIALPFDVQTITHRVKGVVSPFGSSAATPHFWLYSLGNTRFEVATTIEANRAYIISMPLHEEYATQYVLGGDTITFSAVNTVVPPTELKTATCYNKTIVPNFVVKPAAEDVYVMNVGEPYDAAHPEGSVFVANLRSVRPFEAYTTTADAGARFIELFGDEANAVLPTACEPTPPATVYDLQGRKVEAGRALRKGVYVVHGRSVVY